MILFEVVHYFVYYIACFSDIPEDTEKEQIIRGLKQIVSEVLTKEANAVEERIRIFTEQQTQALDQLRERALKEHRSLAR